MRAYVMTTGIVFAMLVLAHVWRVVLEGWHIAMGPLFALTTIGGGRRSHSGRGACFAMRTLTSRHSHGRDCQRVNGYDLAYPIGFHPNADPQ